MIYRCSSFLMWAKPFSKNEDIQHKKKKILLIVLKLSLLPPNDGGNSNRSTSDVVWKKKLYTIFNFTKKTINFRFYNRLFRSKLNNKYRIKNATGWPHIMNGIYFQEVWSGKWSNLNVENELNPPIRTRNRDEAFS